MIINKHLISLELDTTKKPVLEENGEPVFSCEDVEVRWGNSLRSNWMEANGFVSDGKATGIIVVNNGKLFNHATRKMYECAAPWWEDAVTRKGIKVNGAKYYAAGFTASGAKECDSIWCTGEFYKAHEEWANCGLIAEDWVTDGKPLLHVTKWTNYIWSLLGSTGVPVANYPLPTNMPESLKKELRAFNPRKWVCLKSVKWAKDGLLDCLDSSEVGKLVRKMSTDNQKIDDGDSIFVLDLNKLDDEGRKFVKEHPELLEGKTIRLPWCKGLMIVVTKQAIEKFLNELDWDGNVPDAWGISRNILDAEVICFTNVFKAWEAYGNAAKRCGYDDPWAYYCDQLDKYGYTMFVCVTPHVVWKNLPYQMVQYMDMTDSELYRYSNPIFKRTFEVFEDKDAAARLLHDTQGAIVRRDARWMKHPYFTQKMGEAFFGHAKRVAEGQLPMQGKYGFISVDPRAILFGIYCHATGKKIAEEKDNYINTLLGDKESFTRIVKMYNTEREAAGKRPVKKFAIGRNPQCGNDMVIETYCDLDDFEEAEGWYFGTTVFVSPEDFQNLSLMDDYDGDKVLVCPKEDTVRIIERTHLVYDDVPFQYDGVKPSTVLAPSVANVRASLLVNSPATIGVKSLGLMKALATHGYRAVEIAAGTEAYNNDIDVKKYGGEASVSAQQFEEDTRKLLFPASRAWHNADVKQMVNSDFRSVTIHYEDVVVDGKIVRKHDAEEMATSMLDRLTSKLRKKLLAIKWGVNCFKFLDGVEEPDIRSLLFSMWETADGWMSIGDKATCDALGIEAVGSKIHYAAKQLNNLVIHGKAVQNMAKAYKYADDKDKINKDDHEVQIRLAMADNALAFRNAVLYTPLFDDYDNELPSDHIFRFNAIVTACFAKKYNVSNTALDLLFAAFRAEFEELTKEPIAIYHEEDSYDNFDNIVISEDGYLVDSETGEVFVD